MQIECICTTYNKRHYNNGINTIPVHIRYNKSIVRHDIGAAQPLFRDTQSVVISLIHILLNCGVQRGRKRRKGRLAKHI